MSGFNATGPTREAANILPANAGTDLSRFPSRLSAFISFSCGSQVGVWQKPPGDERETRLRRRSDARTRFPDAAPRFFPPRLASRKTALPLLELSALQGILSVFPEVSRSHTSSWRSRKPGWIPGRHRAPRQLRLGLSGSDTGGGNNHYLMNSTSKHQSRLVSFVLALCGATDS